MSASAGEPPPADRSPVFVTTHWSVVLSARDQDSSRSVAALESLCRTYWHPLYAYARRRGYFTTAGQDPNILLRMKEDYDGAEPSPNSVAALNLLRLSQMLDEKSLRELGGRTMADFGERLRQAPGAMPQMMVAVDFNLTKPKQIVIAGKPDAADTHAMLRVVHENFIPNKIILLADGGDGQAFLGRHLEFNQGVKPGNGKATAFVCQDYVCQLPTSDVVVVSKLLAGKSRALEIGE